MANSEILIHIIIMAAVTYLIRMLPLTLIKKKITNKYILSFLYYMPYAVLGAMTFPAILFSTSSIISAAVGMAVAIVLAYSGRSLITVAALSCIAVYAAELCIAL